jgi:hypothetical protein
LFCKSSCGKFEAKHTKQTDLFMDELNLLRKKTGMTIAKAWMVMVTCVIVFILGAGIIGGVLGYQKVDAQEFMEEGVFILLVLILTLSSLWGFYINKKQLPFFNKSSVSVVFVCIIVSLAWSYISPIIVEFLPFNEKESDNIERVGIHFLLGVLSSTLFTVLQIGIIGHGLLKNYLFKQVIFTVAAVSIVMVIPQAVIGLFFQTTIMFYIYYRTASFLLPLIMTVIFNIVEDIFKFYLDSNIVTRNYIKFDFVQNETLYFVGLLVCIAIIIGGLYFIKTQTKVIAWQRPEEDEDLAFL